MVNKLVDNNAKEELRQKVYNLLRKQKEEERLAKSLIIQSKLFNMLEFQKAKVILFYVSFDGEVNTLEMIKLAQEMGKKIGVPRIDQKNKRIIPSLLEQSIEKLSKGPYGIKQPTKDQGEPLEHHELSLVVVPGVAFDKQNNRLGRGGGYYDRFLSELPSNIPSFGLAFDFQLMENLPGIQKHDQPVSAVITN
ncbi:MAG: 5-formyltetrahydrofolate cyclo-ligase [Candidatus Omnitrophica bacterium]|nr:5-formyltetrahydrofolate cyclo-ligase [Candidatus Omnitrophota bacterium]